MKKIENATIFQCEYCTRVSLSGGGIKRHEMFCKKNPNNHPLCVSCAHLIAEEYYITEYDGADVHYTFNEIEKQKDEYEDFGRLEYHKVTEFTCSVDGKKMYHNKVNAMAENRKMDIIGRCDRMMPQECEHYQCYLDV